MKSLQNYIYESQLSFNSEISANIQSLLNDLTNGVNLSNLKEINDEDPNRFDISKENEQLFIDNFSKKNNEYAALSTQDYYLSLGENTEWENLSNKEKADFDTKNGDIIIVDKNNKPICFVDIKTSKKYLGAVSLGSLANFNENGYYICICINDKKIKYVSHKALVKAAKENKELIMPVMRGRKEGYPVKWEGENLTSGYFIPGKKIEQMFK